MPQDNEVNSESMIGVREVVANSEYQSYVKSFRDRLAAAGLPEDAVQAAELKGFDLALEIKPVSQILFSDIPLPEDIQALFSEIFPFPISVRQIRLNDKYAEIDVKPNMFGGAPEGRYTPMWDNTQHIMYDPQDTSGAAWADKVKFALDKGSFSVGTPTSSMRYMPGEEENMSWSSEPISESVFNGFKQIVRYADNIPHNEAVFTSKRKTPAEPVGHTVIDYKAVK